MSAEVTPAAAGIAPVAPDSDRDGRSRAGRGRSCACHGRKRESPAVAQEPSEPSEPAVEASPTVEAVAAVSGGEGEAAVAVATEAKPGEPEMIEVWRPAGRAEKRPPRPQHRRPHKPAEAPAASADGARRGGRRFAGCSERRSVPSVRIGVIVTNGSSARIDSISAPIGKDGRGTVANQGPRRDRPRRERDQGPDRAEREKYYAKPIAVPTVATSSRIPTRRSPSSPRSSSSLSRARNSIGGGAGSSAHRQMALARAHRAHARRCRRAGAIRPCAAERQKVTAASQLVRVGDVLTLALDRTVRVMRIEGFAEKRGAAPRGARIVPRSDQSRAAACSDSGSA